MVTKQRTDTLCDVLTEDIRLPMFLGILRRNRPIVPSLKGLVAGRPRTRRTVAAEEAIIDIVTDNPTISVRRVGRHDDPKLVCWLTVASFHICYNFVFNIFVNKFLI